jgi:hypothetical protein
MTKATRLVLGCMPRPTWLVRSTSELEALGRERSAGTSFVQGSLVCVTTDLRNAARALGWADAAAFDGAAGDDAVLTELRDLIRGREIGGYADPKTEKADPR